MAQWVGRKSGRDPGSIPAPSPPSSVTLCKSLSLCALPNGDKSTALPASGVARVHTVKDCQGLRNYGNVGAGQWCYARDQFGPTGLILETVRAWSKRTHFHTLKMALLHLH